jgi:hypothetical protein
VAVEPRVNRVLSPCDEGLVSPLFAREVAAVIVLCGSPLCYG